MLTAVLVGLTVVLVVAAAYVGLLLLRRSRTVPAEEPAGPRTVADLVRLRSMPPGDLSGDELFTPAEPRADVEPRPVGERGSDDDAGRTVEVAVPLPARSPATPADGVEVGDAPWRRAARMMGTEPGAGWDTAPIPIVPGREPDADLPAVEDAAVDRGRTEAVSEGTAEPAAAVDSDMAVESGVVVDVEGAPQDDMAGSGSTAAEPPETSATDDPDVDPVAVSDERAVVLYRAPEGPAPAAPESDGPDPNGPSRPLSDPDLTPLMGIPVVRPTEIPSPPDDEPGVAADLDPPAPQRRPSERDDDEVVTLLGATITSPFPAVPSGSPQPVWFRVVRRDGGPVAAAVVALLDPHGREVDTTKTATDGGGELRAPHGGRFLMVASADGFQPRAALLTVEEQPVEIALLLPRSAVVVGAVQVGSEPVHGATVAVRQEGEVVDEAVTGRDGAFRFDDLAEGGYAVSATHARGSAVRQAVLSEGADLRLDLDLEPPDAAG